MLEQQLINAFMKLTARIGAGDLVRDMIRQVEDNGNPKAWTALEMERAIHFINMHTENFGKQEAVSVIHSLLKKFNIAPEDLEIRQPSSESTGIQGLQ